MAYKKRTVYRDYREGKEGQFTDKKAFQEQGPADGVHRETVEVNLISDVMDLFAFDDSDQEDFFEQEYHGTGDTGAEA
jgi:hypothetical protein